jgi:hypothetical protein
MGTREVWEAPPGAPPKPLDSAPMAQRRAWLQQRLQMHVDQAIQRYRESGLTPRQEAALKTRPGLQRAFRGSRIDEFAKASIMQDPELHELITAPDFVREPDIIDSVLPDWFDVTTSADWQRHLIRYQQTHGAQASLLVAD